MYSNNSVLVTAKSTTIHRLAAQVEQLALSALHDEVSLELKPGLVCPSSVGSHSDMDYALFQKVFALCKAITHRFANWGLHSIPSAIYNKVVCTMNSRC